MRRYAEYMGSHWSEKNQIQFVRRIIRQIVLEADNQNKPMLDMRESLVRYRQRLVKGSYTDSKGVVHKIT